MDSDNSIVPAGTVVVHPRQRHAALSLSQAQPAHPSPDATFVYSEVNTRVQQVPAAWMFTRIEAPWLAALAKRSIDVLGAAVGLVLTAPIWVIAALAVRCDGEGAVLFRQVRVGKDGRSFCMLKFRTMCVDAERRKAELAAHNQMSGPVFKMQNDPRITRLGRFLRKYSIDELPQLVNVLRGEMSLVGPRPALPSEVSQYEPWQHQRLRVKPGLTCLWQVNGRNEVDFEEWMRLDLEYISRFSLGLDLLIILKTVPAVLRGTGV
jgi:exopolysaccharide biosynthesis polyprenyl glycosylphosphotransferase